MSDEREPRSSRDRDVSWSEIDKRRDRSKHVRDDRPVGRRRKQAVTGVSRYKADLSDLFNRGKASARLKAAAAQGGLRIGAPQPERPKALRAILDAVGSTAIGEAVDEFEARFGELPDDPEILMQALDHPDQTKAVAALGRLRDYLVGHAPARRTLMLQRVKAIEMRADEPDARALAAEVRSLLGD